MPVFHDSALIGAAGASGTGAGGYQISRSLRFNSSDSAYLSKTYSTARSGTDCTLSFWIKRHKLGTDQVICATARSGGNQRFLLKFLPSDRLHLVTAGGGYYFTFHPALRDCSAWYHIHWKWDTRDLIWINGVQYSSDNVGIFGGHEWHTHVDAYSNVMQHGIGYHPSNIYETPAPDYGNYTLAEFHSLDNINAPVSSFGETNATTGQWVPKAYTGGYGNNGFRLTFSDNSGTTATTLGKDAAGSNNWTPTNFSVASGAGNDSLVDTPTSYGTDTGAGGEVRGNYATLNPLSASGATLSNGNLDASITANIGSAIGTIGVASGKWYWEVTPNTGSAHIFGVSDITAAPGSRTHVSANGWGYYASNGFKYNNNTGASYGAAYTNGDVIGVALDMDAGQLVFYKNGVSQGIAYSGLTGKTLVPALFEGTGTGGMTYVVNFGQRPFAYTAPSGFKALCDQNLPAPTIAKPSTVMDVVLYTGNSTDNRAITGLGFSPDLVWFGPRSQSGQDKVICDSVRGVQKALFSNQTYVEADPALYGSVGSFDSAGFTIKKGTDATFGFHQVNLNSSTYAAWCWDAGSSTVTNTQGSITGTVSVRANTSAGFSIVSYTSTGSTATVGHGLGVAPSMVITKGRNVVSAFITQHISLAANNVLYLNGTDASQDVSANGSLPKPTATVFSVNNQTGSNGGTYDMIAYCFAPVAGYSSFGSYTGNGSTDGPFVYTGFRPRWIVFKQTNVGGQGWFILDTARSTYNVASIYLLAQSSNAEASGFVDTDFCSNGFKIRSSDGAVNANSGTYIYAAFAENPFQYARAR